MERLRQQDGLGLVEILIAMLLLSIGIMAIVASFSSGTRTTIRSSSTSQAASLADSQMEELRGGRYDDLWCPGRTEAGDAGSPVSEDVPVCEVEPTVSAADGNEYEVKIRVGYDCAIGTVSGVVPDPICTPPSARPTKLVTIIVSRDGRELHRQTSTFDRALGE